VNYLLSLSEAIAQWRLASLERRLSRAGVTVLLDTSVLSEPMRERPDAAVPAGQHEFDPTQASNALLG